MAAECILPPNKVEEHWLRNIHMAYGVGVSCFDNGCVESPQERLARVDYEGCVAQLPYNRSKEFDGYGTLPGQCGRGSMGSNEATICYNFLRWECYRLIA